MPTDLQKKDELRIQLRLLNFVKEELSNHVDSENIVMRMVNERIDDIQKALED